MGLEYEPDGSPKKYPLHQPLWDHGYDWEHWSLIPAGVFHTVYYADFAQDFPPYWAWLQKFPLWVGAPFLILGVFVLSMILQNAGSIGIKPKRYSIEWIQANRERERQENTNPVTRYLDRRRQSEAASGWPSTTCRGTRTRLGCAMRIRNTPSSTCRTWRWPTCTT